MTGDTASYPTAMAAEALRLVGVDARQAERHGELAVMAAKEAGDTAAESMAWRARGLAARETERLDVAERHLRRAVATGSRAGAERAAEARMSLAFVLLERGRSAAARRYARAAVEALSGSEQARARVQLALIQQRSGAAGDALQTYGLALSQVRRAKDELWEARLLNNRGILQAYQGHAAAADRDLERAAELYDSVGQVVMAGEARWNLGFVAGLRGDIVSALEWFDVAGSQLAEAGALRSVSFPDRGLVLLAAGLLGDARRAVETGIANLTAADVASDVAEAQLLLSETLLGLGEVVAARAAATAALDGFVRQGRTRHQLLARHLLLRAAEPDADDLWAAADGLATALRVAGWTVAATDVLLLLARHEVEQGRQPASTALEAAVAAARIGPVGQRLRAWYLVALARRSRGDERGASRALLAGLRVHQRYQATLSATELQVGTAARAAELAEAGLRLAAQGGSPAQILAWAERWRAGSLLVRPVTAPRDPVLAAQLAELRGVSADLQQALLAGEDPVRLERRQRALEKQVTERARTLRADVHQLPIAATPALFAALSDQALVEFVQIGDQLAAVVLAGRRATFHVLAGVATVRAQVEALHFAHRRLAKGSSPQMAIATRASLLAAAERLDALLLAPLAARLKDRSLVLVPTAEMHVLPWGLLSHARNVPVTVAPSASVWLASLEGGRTTRGHVLLVAGPGLTGAVSEVAALGRLYGQASRVLTADRAGVSAVMQGLQGCALAHVAAHGRFRSDNPLFSDLQMADGPITVHDLESLSSAPSVVVLSACDSGLSAVHPGDELMGLTGALLRLGTRSLVASVAPVPDDVAEATMVALHARLKSGDPPAAALFQARSSLDEEVQLRAAAFVCLGAG